MTLDTATRTFFLALVLAATQSHAAVLYQFEGSAAPAFGNPARQHAFQLLLPDFLEPPNSFSCAQLESNLNCGSGVIFISEPNGPTVLAFTDLNGTQYDYNFRAGAFTAIGQHDTIQGPNSGLLRISEQPVPEPVPEPASVATLFTALVAGVGLRRVLREHGSRP